MFQKRLIPKTDDIFKELRAVRQAACVSLEKIYRETKIPIKYLKALEEGSTEMLPDVLYVKNIMKKYLKFFKVDPKPFISRLELEKREAPKKIPKKKSFLVFPRLFKSLLIVILAIAFLSYLGFRLNKIFRSPWIRIDFPADNTSAEASVIEVKGQTEANVTLSINNEQVILGKNNSFTKEINLQKGLNLIKISGMRRYSKENVIWRNVMLEIK